MSNTSAAGPTWHGTTIVSARKNGRVVIAGDGQVSMGQTVMKPNARKVRPIGDGSVIVELSFAGADWLVREVLKEAGDAAVLEPAEAREAVREALAGAHVAHPHVACATDFVMEHLNRNAQGFKHQRHFGAHVLRAVNWRYGKITTLDSWTVAAVAAFQLGA